MGYGAPELLRGVGALGGSRFSFWQLPSPLTILHFKISNNMEEYVLLFRLDILTKEIQPSPEQMQVYMKQYQDWVGGIAAQNKFVGGTGLSTEGKVVKHPNMVTDGPYVDIKESLAGFISVRAADFEDALRMARECPILGGAGNSVEVRKVVSVHENKK